MSLYRRGKIWYYSFEKYKKKFQGSTGCTNKNDARLVEAKMRTLAAHQQFEIVAPKAAPGFREFMQGRFLDDVRQNAKKPATILFYESRTRSLLKFPPFQTCSLNDVMEEMIADFVRWRTIVGTHKATTIAENKSALNANFNSMSIRPAATPTSIATVNRELITISRALKLAYRWQLIKRMPLIKRLPGERNREFVLSQEMERQYLELCEYPLRQFAILCLDTGMRPEECLKLRKTDVLYDAVTAGNEAIPLAIVGVKHMSGSPMPTASQWSIFIRKGKSRNAIRTLPLTDRAREVIALLLALWPDSEWLFPGRRGGHLGRWALNRAHLRIRDKIAGPEFVLYTARHTFGTRLGESGASPFAIMKAMGHYSIEMSQKYVHFSDEGVRLALLRKEAGDKLLRGEPQSDTSGETAANKA